MTAAQGGRWLLGVAVLLAALVPIAAAVTPDPPAQAGPVAAAVPPDPPAPPAPVARGFTVLQLNLCNSGMAGCYAGGQAVPEAATMIARIRPDAVTLNEICRRDLDQLATAIRQAFPGEVSYQHFQPVYDNSGAVFPCTNGDPFGIGVVGHRPAGTPATTARGGAYPMQDIVSNEGRVWLCAHQPGLRYVCATHLSADRPAVTAAQCRHLVGTALPQTRTRLGGGNLPAVIGGDLNMKAGGDPDAWGCVPAGWSRTDDGGLQHVLTTGLAIAGSRTLLLRHTDHPGLLVSLRGPGEALIPAHSVVAPDW